MSPTVFPLGYTNSNYLSDVVTNQSKPLNTGQQIVTSTSRDITNGLMPYLTNSTATDTADGDIITKAEVHAWILLIWGIFLIALLYYMDCRRPRSRCLCSNLRPSHTPSETTLLQHKTMEGGQPPFNFAGEQLE